MRSVTVSWEFDVIDQLSTPTSGAHAGNEGRAGESVARKHDGAARGSLLEVEHLSIGFRGSDSWVDVVSDVSLSIGHGETHGIVGESGSGKTLTAMAILGLIPTFGGRIRSGSIRFNGVDMVNASERELAEIRGRQIGMIFQQPTRSLNPASTVGEQVAETIRVHLKVSRREAWRRAVRALDRVHIPAAERRARDYPHQFSGGMCQRVMLALALACDPALLIADEPTTALDVTVQARILELINEVQEEFGLSVMMISHDLAVIARHVIG